MRKFSSFFLIFICLVTVSRVQGEDQYLPVEEMVSHYLNNLYAEAEGRFAPFYHEGKLRELDSIEADLFLKQKNSIQTHYDALTSIIVQNSSELFNQFIFFALSDYLERPDSREYIEWVMESLIGNSELLIKNQHQHACWKEAGLGSIDAFYILMTIEVIRAAGSKSRLVSGALRRTHGVVMGLVSQGGPLRGALTRTARETLATGPKLLKKLASLLAREGVQDGVQVGAQSLATNAALVTLNNGATRSHVLEKLASLGGTGWRFIRDPRVWEKIIGTPGMSRMARVLAAGALLGAGEGLYSYHIVEQRLDPKLLFRIAKMMLLLDFSLRSHHLKEDLLEKLGNGLNAEDIKELSLDSNKWSDLFTDYGLLKGLTLQLENEVTIFERNNQDFLANVFLPNLHPLDPSLPTRAQGEFVPEFLRSFEETFPEYGPILQKTRVVQDLHRRDEFREVSAVSLKPIQEELEEVKHRLERFEKLVSELLQKGEIRIPLPRENQK